jgi:hypothetical protein
MAGLVGAVELPELSAACAYRSGLVGLLCICVCPQRARALPWQELQDQTAPCRSFHGDLCCSIERTSICCSCWMIFGHDAGAVHKPRVQLIASEVWRFGSLLCIRQLVQGAPT